jgi:hypothetical protein
MIYHIENGIVLRDIFRWYGKEQEYSLGGFDALYEYYYDVNAEYPLDVLAVCREWKEFRNMSSAIAHYGLTDPEDFDQYLVTNLGNVLISHDSVPPHTIIGQGEYRKEYRS